MRAALLAAALLALPLTAGTAAAAAAQERYTYIHHSVPTNVFWQAVKKGMDDACAQIRADCQMVFLQEDGNFQEQLNNLEAAIAEKPDGIIMTFSGGEIFDEALARAEAAGIPVMASNVDHPQRAHRLAYVGQDLEIAGYELAKAQSANFPKTGPLNVLVGINGPGQVWSEQRAHGVMRFLDEYAAAHPDRHLAYDKIDAGLNLETTGQRVAAYVQSKPIQAYFDTGYLMAGAAVTLRDLGKKPGEVLLAGFDLVPVVFDEMASGWIQLTVDQQPYLQGYYPIQELHLYNAYKFKPLDINTGKALVGPGDAKELRALSEQAIR